MQRPVQLARVLPLLPVHAGPDQGEAGDMTFMSHVCVTTEERMSRKLSLTTLALFAALLATPVMAQQPAGGKDSSTATHTMAKKGHKHHKKGAAAMAKDSAKKDSTKK